MLDHPIMPISKIFRVFSDHIHPASFKNIEEIRDFLKNNNYQKLFESPDGFLESYQRPGWPMNQGNIIFMDPSGNILDFKHFQL